MKNGICAGMTVRCLLPIKTNKLNHLYYNGDSRETSPVNLFWDLSMDFSGLLKVPPVKQFPA